VPLIHTVAATLLSVRALRAQRALAARHGEPVEIRRQLGTFSTRSRLNEGSSPSDASRRPKSGTPEQRVVKSGPVLTGGSVTVTGIITAIIVGLIIGALGRLVVPGKQNIPIWLTIVIGVVAALVGTLLARGIGLATGPGFHIGELIVQIVLAALGVFLVAGAYSRRGIRG
jgi:uncharacterized membrane protein YeaQ/YmgE (transglycosylase-associated protein family)